jgi:hypothetical protein
MSRIYNPISMNDAKPILTQKFSGGDELELQTMVRQAIADGDEKEYVNVTAPTNLPAGYELIVDVMDGSFWTVQVVRSPDDNNDLWQTCICLSVLVILFVIYLTHDS